MVMTQFKIYDDNRKERNLMATLIKNARKQIRLHRDISSTGYLKGMKNQLHQLKSIAKEYPK